jgi:hypothetical protein
MRFVVMMVLGWSIAASAAAWQLPLPRGPENVSGALVMMGEGVYQAKDFGLQATAEGRIVISWLQGYDAEGGSIRIERTLQGATSLGFARAAVGVDSAGFLLVGAPGSLAALAVPDYPCGMTHVSSCTARECAHCGDAPACSCLDVSGGGCDTVARDYCDGRCTAGTCNGSVNSCGCIFVDSGAAPSVTGPTSKKAPRLQPANPPQ